MGAQFTQLSGFKKAAKRLLSTDDLRDLHNELIENPDGGDVIADTNGARKLRIRLPGHGKRGGGRVIYWCNKREEHFYLIFLYAKNAQSELTSADKKLIRAVIAELEKQ